MQNEMGILKTVSGNESKTAFSQRISECPIKRGRGFFLAELMHPKMMNEKKHDTVKNTNAKFEGKGRRLEKALPVKR